MLTAQTGQTNWNANRAILKFMISKQEFWNIIEDALKHSQGVGSLEQDNNLIQALEKRPVADIVGFQLRMLDLQRDLHGEHLYTVAEQLDYAGHPDVLNRFKNGIIASGQTFYEHSKNNPEFLISMYRDDPQKLRACYYEGLSLVAPAAFYEVTDHKVSWDNALRKEKRKMEIYRQVPEQENDWAEEMER